MIRVNTFLPKPQIAALDAHAEQRDVTRAELIREAIAEWLKRQKEEKR